ncbi:flavocytochrome c [Lysinibacillus sp. SGAir0095]|uniref:FAD-dependent oxidoreductase n=1 Tax=Lysinibacillus sp. SGAir0095 TaxID=2070463 RepID=UPI0010CD6B6C|nr:flavocytochrome c [Lysinibacillus sp. SGAir0095]QCR32140.1 flavocytochrome c [Lysinibacillus sp. SGAir0095]
MGESYSVIIVGAGMAGLCAALEAANSNAKVLVLEKEEAIGGSSLLSGRFMAFAGTDLQKKCSFVDNSELLIADMLEVGKGKNEKKLVEAYGHHQLETYQWLVENGVEFDAVRAASGHSVPRGHTIKPLQAITTLYNQALKTGNVTFELEASVKRLRKNADGRISVVIYEKDGLEYFAKAEQGVILTCGGFSKSEEMLESFAPQLHAALRIGGKGNVGDGIKLAWEHGAWIRDLPYLQGTYGFHPAANGERKSQAHAFYKGAIIVNKKGKRFVNESHSYKIIGTEALKQQETVSYQVWDQPIMNESVAGDALYDFENLYSLGLINQADSIEELADIINVPLESFKETIAKYNEDIQTGVDQDFGRTSLTHTFGKPKPIIQAPYYAMVTTVAMLATYAGLAVDENAQVLNPFNEPIDGLYAAGEIAGGFHGAGYMTGSSLGKASIFGKIAAKKVLSISVPQKDNLSI